MTTETQATDPAPLPCPFCGCADGLSFEDGSNYRWGLATCVGCGATTGEVRRAYPDDGAWHADAIKEWNTRAAIPAPEGADALPDETLDCWRTNYGLDKSPHELHAFWEGNTPTGAVLALKSACGEIERLRAALAAPAPQAAPASHAEFALRALVAAGHITQDTADEAMRIAKRAHGIPAPQTKEQP